MCAGPCSFRGRADHALTTRSLEATGLCHTDHHARTGDLPVPLPQIGGHEGAGVVVDVGAGVRDLKVGDHVVTSFLPACGRCRWCSSGQQNLCDFGAMILAGTHLDGTAAGRDVGAASMLGTFAQMAPCLRRRWSRSTTTSRWRQPACSAAAAPPAGVPRSTPPRSAQATAGLRKKKAPRSRRDPLEGRYLRAVQQSPAHAMRGGNTAARHYFVRYSISARRIVSPRLTPSIADRSSVRVTRSSGNRTE